MIVMEKPSRHAGDRIGVPAEQRRRSTAGPDAVTEDRPLAVSAVRRDTVMLSQRFHAGGHDLAAAIADRLQIVTDPDEPTGLRIVARTASQVRLMADIAEQLAAVPAAQGVELDVLVDAILRQWLARQDLARPLPVIKREDRGGAGRGL
ncbi:hypothetical protein, partial [Staphylococcus capitis]|uniref:hypothetical protein n=1 Tax=Staphylococcus capitis TaxID=29388 RepID=UPI003CFFFA7E